MTKIILLTGFLGAGKTTFLKRILKEYGTHQIGIIVNEFGKVGVDGRLIEKAGLELVEISNGSVFCACLKENFVDSLIKMVGLKMEYLFIEASGLADPSTMKGLLEGIKHRLTYPADYRGAICILDGENFLELLDLLPALRSQVEYSHVALINKIDEIEPNRIVKIEETLREINECIGIHRTNYCQVNPRAIIEELMPVEREERDSTNTYESRPRTIIGTMRESVNEAQLSAFLRGICPGTYRIKGILRTDAGLREVSCVGERIELSEWVGETELDEIGKLVFISSVGPALLTQLAEQLKKRPLSMEISL